jgi:hypothetical protein
MMTRLAAAIVGKYPLAWRERYEVEVQELLIDSPVSIGDVCELGRGLIIERIKSLIEPADHPVMTDWGFRTVAWLISIAPAVTLVVGGAAFGLQLGAWFGEPSKVVLFVALICCLSVVAIDIGARRIFRVELGRAFNLGLVLLSVVFIVTWHWARTPSDSGSAQFQALAHWSQLFIWSTVAHRLLATRFPWRPMFDAVERYQAASEAVRRAQAEVDRSASAEGPAQWQLMQLERERDEAKAQVDSFGYRARFQR